MGDAQWLRSLSRRMGFSLPMTGALLGHQEASTTQCYLPLVHDLVEQAAQVVEDALARTLGSGHS